MLTRRDRLERIASAERDRRAGRIELAVASLGEGAEWPARVVLALARLPEEEGQETRTILMASLDAWAADAGLDPLSDLPPSEACVVDETGPRAPEGLEAPIGADELDAAFDQAEAQVEEMHDANRVAERILMEEPMGLAELSGESFEAADEGEAEQPFEAAGEVEAERPFEAAGEVEAELPSEAARELEAELLVEDTVDNRADGLESEATHRESDTSETDAAWAEAPIWPTPEPVVDAAAFDVLADCTEGADASLGRGTAGSNDFEARDAALADRAAPAASPKRTPRPVVLATLERWLTNLETQSARRAQ